LVSEVSFLLNSHMLACRSLSNNLSSAPAPHHSLSTFLAYAAATSLSRTSTLHLGTTFEYLAQIKLRKYGFEVSRTGGRGDSGIDLLGTWPLPDQLTPAGPLRVLIQCKAAKARVGPSVVRELEGTFRSAPLAWRREDEEGRLLGIVVSQHGATAGVREAMASSRRGLVWVKLAMNDAPQPLSKEDILQSYRRPIETEEDIVRSATVRQILWNRTAADMGLGGLDVTLSYTEPAPSVAASSLPEHNGSSADMGLRDQIARGGAECILLWQGRPLEGVDTRTKDGTSTLSGGSSRRTPSVNKETAEK